jgi:hypothetical protein
MSTTTHELKNVFQAAADLQRQPREIQQAARALNLQPVARHTGLALFTPEQLQRIDQHIAEQHEANDA